MFDEKETCSGCYWEAQCADELRCDDYTPLECDGSEYYRDILKENAEEYQVIIHEFLEGESGTVYYKE